jgi:hypothetical protein
MCVCVCVCVCVIEKKDHNYGPLYMAYFIDYKNAEWETQGVCMIAKIQMTTA